MNIMGKYIGKIIVLHWFFLTPCMGEETKDVVAMDVDSAITKEPPFNQVIRTHPINPIFSTVLNPIQNIVDNKESIEHALARITLSKAPLNAAEQYLLLVIKALFEEQTNHTLNKSQQIIALLSPANELSKKISEQQLSHPEFLKMHLLLAKYYAVEGQYDLAYIEKKNYLKKYYIYRKNKRLAMIESLEQSFVVKDKKANNALLLSQNSLKVRRVAEVKEKNSSQQYNFTLIISTAIVFVLLFFRQLRIRNQLIKLTRTDALTGVANRSALFEHGEEMVANFAKQPTEFSVLLLDLDHFKKINDNFGHQVGDKVLMIVSQLVQETMRSRDVFSRLGGEEFVALLPFADSNKAKAIAMRINDKIAQYDFSSLMIQSKITISIGVATMEHNKMSFDDVLHCADLAMYQAKEQGRNTVVCYQNIAGTQERRTTFNAG